MDQQALFLFGGRDKDLNYLDCHALLLKMVWESASLTRPPVGV